MKSMVTFAKKSAVGHPHQVNSGNVLISVLLNAIITIAEFIGGIMSHSLALLSDALHNLSDTLAIAFSYMAIKISRRHATPHKTFGYKRFEIIAAFINSLILIGISGYLFWEAYKRFSNPEPVGTGLMLVVAIIGLLANLFAIILLHRDAGKSLNIKAAFLHLLGDTLSSAGVVLGAVVMHYWGLYWVDPALTVAIGILIIWNSRAVLKESYNILMQGTPENMDISRIKRTIEQYPEVNNLHHVHVWRLNDFETHFECHVDLAKDLRVSDADQLRMRIEKLLQEKFSVQHITLQMEHGSCNSQKTIVDSGAPTIA